MTGTATTADTSALIGRTVHDRRDNEPLGVITGVAENYSDTDLPVYYVVCDDRRRRRFYGDEIRVGL